MALEAGTIEGAGSPVKSFRIERSRLAASLRAAPSDPDVWVSLSELVETPEETFECLRRANDADPSSTRLRERIADLWFAPPDFILGRDSEHVLAAGRQVCPTCKAQVSPGDRVCRYCASPIPVIDTAALSSSTQKDAGVRIYRSISDSVQQAVLDAEMIVTFPSALLVMVIPLLAMVMVIRARPEFACLVYPLTVAACVWLARLWWRFEIPRWRQRSLARGLPEDELEYAAKRALLTWRAGS